MITKTISFKTTYGNKEVAVTNNQDNTCTIKVDYAEATLTPAELVVLSGAVKENYETLLTNIIENEEEEDDEEPVEEVDYDSLSEEDKAYYNMHKEHEKVFDEEYADFCSRLKAKGIEVDDSEVEWSDIFPEPTEE